MSLKNKSRIRLSFETKIISDSIHIVSMGSSFPWVDLERQKCKLEFVKAVADAVNSLRLIERKIIIKRYLARDTKYNYKIADEMGISLRSYERYKASAVYNLAELLGAIEYEE